MATALRSRRSSGSRSRSHRRRPLWARVLPWGLLLLAAALAVALGALIGTAGLALFDGRSLAEQGQSHLLDGELEPATAAFAGSNDEFASATARLDNPLVRTVALLPVVGANLDALLAMSRAGVELAAAGETVAAAGADIGGGIGALAPRDGVIPTAPLAALAEPAAAAADRVDAAAGEVEAISPAWLLGPVESARTELTDRVEQVRRPARAAAGLTATLPAFLGADGERDYFFAAGNPSELRGTGGFLGAWTTLTAADGAVDFGEFTSIGTLDDLASDEIEPPHPDYAARYDRYGGAGFWRNINITPDFPMAATAIRNLYAATEGDELDGVIVATPAALARLLEVTGPVEVPDAPEFDQVDAESVVDDVVISARDEFTSSGVRKTVLGEVAATVVAAFLSGEATDDPVEAGRALADVVGSGDLLIHAGDADVQTAFDDAGVAGELGHPEGASGDYFTIVGTAGASYKLDYFVERRIRYDVVPWPDGSTRSTASVTFINTAPGEELPGAVTGPGRDDLAAGEMSTITSAYCAPGCALMDHTRDGEPQATTSERELGYPVFSSLIELASGDQTELTYRFRTPEAWQPTPSGGSYRFTFDDQTTIPDTELEVSVALPDGVEVARTSHDMIVGDGEVTWSGTPGASEVFEIEFRRPPGALLRERIRSLWADPVGG